MKRHCGNEQEKVATFGKLQKRLIFKTTTTKKVDSTLQCWFWRLFEAASYVDRTGEDKCKNRAEVSKGEGRVVVTDPCQSLERCERYKDALHPNIKQNARQERRDIQFSWTKQETRQRESQKRNVEILKSLHLYFFMNIYRKNRGGVKGTRGPTHRPMSWQEPRYSPVPCMKPARQPALGPAVPAQLA